MNLFKNTSVKKRFAATLIANIIKAGLGFISGIIIARTMGPSVYGDYSFLLGSFLSIAALMNMGSSSAFYTFLSQKRRGKRFYLYYIFWIAAQFIFISTFITFIFPSSWRIKIWFGHPKGLVLLAFIASFMMNKIWQIVAEAGESIRATVIVQGHNIALIILYLSIVSIMALFGKLTIANLFITIFLLYLCFSVILTKRLVYNLIAKEDEDFSKIIREFRSYCAPLLMLAVVSFFYSFADVWLLQRFGGSTQQGFYSVGFRFSAICLIATTSIVKVFWKEMAESHELGDEKRLHKLFTKVSRIFCFISALVSCFLIPFSREILVFVLGKKYESGWPCLAIMFLYPIHQSLGQITNIYFYATNKTRLRSMIGIIMMTVSIAVTYFILADNSSIIPGLGLGSVGLALKVVILNIILVNALLYFIRRISGWKIDFLYQFAVIGPLLMVSFSIRWVVGNIVRGIFSVINPLAVLGLCIPVYLFIVGLAVYLFPNLIGAEREDIDSAVKFLKSYFSGTAYI